MTHFCHVVGVPGYTTKTADREGTLLPRALLGESEPDAKTNRMSRMCSSPVYTVKKENDGNKERLSE